MGPSQAWLIAGARPVCWPLPTGLRAATTERTGSRDRELDVEKQEGRHRSTENTDTGCTHAIDDVKAAAGSCW